MKPNRISVRIAILLGLLVAFACAASAGTAYVYNVTGTFLSSHNNTGPLNGGSFNGTFIATLPVNAGSETISTFDVQLFEPFSITPLVTFSNTSGDIGFIRVNSGPDCAISTRSVGSCDLFVFDSANFQDQLELATPLGFTGGSVIPGNFLKLGYSMSQGTVNGFTPVVSGAIDPVNPVNPVTTTPEPATFALLGTALLAGLLIERKRLFA